MNGPYRQVLTERSPRERTLDPWLLALLFAWVCDLGRIGLGILDRRGVGGELGFGALLAMTTFFVAGVRLRRRTRKDRASSERL
jgi:hypothetical protein